MTDRTTAAPEYMQSPITVKSSLTPITSSSPALSQQWCTLLTLHLVYQDHCLYCCKAQMQSG